MKRENFVKQVEKFEKYFNAGVFEESGQRSVNCKAGRLEIYVQLYEGKISANIYTHPNETAFESEVFHKNVKTVKEGVELLKKEEAKLVKKKTWCDWFYDEKKKNSKIKNFEKREKLDLKINELLEKAEQEITDLEFFSQKDRMECFPEKKKDYTKGINKVRELLTKIENLANQE